MGEVCQVAKDVPRHGGEYTVDSKGGSVASGESGGGPINGSKE